MPRIFISHSTKDNEISRKLATRLKQDGTEIRIEYERMSGSYIIPASVWDAILWSDVVVLVWSQSAASSYFVSQEWSCALVHQKQIISCRVDNTRLPAILSEFLSISFKNLDLGYHHLAQNLKLIPKTKTISKRILNSLIVKKKSIRISAKFRCQPAALSDDQVKAMLRKYDFYDSIWNVKGHGFANQYKRINLKGDRVIIDNASGLMWQQSGSVDYFPLDQAKDWIDRELNQAHYGGFSDWRLPTLEEAMTLMETKKMNEDLYIDPIFDPEQRWIWTCDLVQGAFRAWIVSFYYGICSNLYAYNLYVRAVRLFQDGNDSENLRYRVDKGIRG